MIIFNIVSHLLFCWHKTFINLLLLNLSSKIALTCLDKLHISLELATMTIWANLSSKSSLFSLWDMTVAISIMNWLDSGWHLRCDIRDRMAKWSWESMVPSRREKRMHELRIRGVCGEDDVDEVKELASELSHWVNWVLLTLVRYPFEINAAQNDGESLASEDGSVTWDMLEREIRSQVRR